MDRPSETGVDHLPSDEPEVPMLANTEESTSSSDGQLCVHKQAEPADETSVAPNGFLYLRSVKSSAATYYSLHLEKFGASCLPLDLVKPDHPLHELHLVDCGAVNEWILRLMSMRTDLLNLKKLEMVRCTHDGEYLAAGFLVTDIILFCPNLTHLKLDGTCQPNAIDFQRLVRRLRSLQSISFTPRGSDFLYNSDVATMHDPGDLSHLTLGSKLKSAVRRFERFKERNPDYLIVPRELLPDTTDDDDDDSATDCDDTKNFGDVQVPV